MCVCSGVRMRVCVLGFTKSITYIELGFRHYSQNPEYLLNTKILCWPITTTFSFSAAFFIQSLRLVTTILRFQKCYVNAIIHYVTSAVFVFSIGIILLISIQVIVFIKNSFLLILISVGSYG